MARVTLSDVAARVGVSPKTVSNVVNEKGWVSDSVRAQVLKVIDELGYKPNIAARQLRSGKTGMFAFGIPDLREPYFAELSSQFVDLAHARGLNVLITQTGGKREEEKAFISGKGLPNIDGLVLSPLGLRKGDLEERRGASPLVLVGEHGASIGTKTSIHVGIDNVAAGHAATDFLVSKGRRRIAVIGVQHEGSTETSRLRFEGYKSALRAASIEIDERLFGAVTTFNRAEGSRAVNEIIATGAAFDGIFCFSDTLAFGALYALAVHGYTVPHDVELIGFDDIDEGRYSVPAFSTMNARTDLTSKTVLDILTGKRPPTPRHIDIPFQLIKRA